MTTYYYDCPIKALYMIREFGVKLYLLGLEECSCDLETGEMDFSKKEIKIDFEEEYLDQILGSFKEIKDLDAKIYVAKESEDIFEPKHDDLGLTEKDLLPCVFNYKNKWMGLSIIGDYGIKEDEKCFITMRNNKQFFQPLTENNV